MAIGTTMLGVIGAGAGLAGAAMQSSAAGRAADAQERAAQDQIALARESRDQIRADLAPFVGGGRTGQEAFQFELGLGARPEGYRGFTSTPGYQFALDRGMDAMQSTAAARGNLLSGSALASAQRLGQGMAAQDYGQHLNRLAALGQTGQSAAAMQGQAGQNFAQMGSNALANMGNAQAAGAIGQANAWSGGMNNMMQSLAFMNTQPRQQQQGQQQQGQQPQRANIFSTPWASGGFFGSM